MKNTVIALFVVVLLVSSAFGVGAATQAGILIPTAIPFALILISIIRLLGPKIVASLGDFHHWVVGRHIFIYRRGCGVYYFYCVCRFVYFRCIQIALFAPQLAFSPSLGFCAAGFAAKNDGFTAGLPAF